MEYGIILYCKNKKLQTYFNTYNDYPMHLTLGYSNQIYIDSIIDRLNKIKKFKIVINQITIKNKQVILVPNTKLIFKLLYKIAELIKKLPKSGFHITIANKGKLNLIQTKIKNEIDFPFNLEITKLWIMKKTNDKWSRYKTIFLK